LEFSLQDAKNKNPKTGMNFFDNWSKLFMIMIFMIAANSLPPRGSIH
jgi:hypothetical protein